MDTPRKRILLALDGSDTSLETVRYVAKIFPVARTEIVLFHVAANIPGIFWHIGEEFRDRIAPARAWVHETHRAMSAFMHAAAHELTHAGFSPETVTVKIERQQNSIVRDIAAEAACDYDAVVVSRQGSQSHQRHPDRQNRQPVDEAIAQYAHHRCQRQPDHAENHDRNGQHG